MADIKSLTTKEVARLCRVSAATVKRWAEAGLLASERTTGGHRRFRAEEVARFQRETGLGVRQTAADASAVKTAALRRASKKSHSDSPLFHALVGGREAEAAEILINAFLAGTSLPLIFDTVLSEPMRRIGELWFMGELSIGQEHLATRCVMNALQKLRAIIPAPESNGKLAMCCTIEGDLHELSTHLIEMLLESAGWETINFGANLPLYVLTEQVLAHSPRLAVVSATILSDLERVAKDFKEFRTRTAKTNLSVVLGGHGFDDRRVRARFAADVYADDFSQFDRFIRSS